MKKNKIRLTLSRETLRSLVSDETSKAQGGGVTTTPACQLLTNSCFNCITQNTCPTHCGQTYCYYV
jgi:hypothetical protein